MTNSKAAMVLVDANENDKRDEICQIIAADLAGNDWHALSRADQQIERLLVKLEYLTPASNGFVGKVIPRTNIHLFDDDDEDKPDFDPADLATPTSPGFDFNT